MHVWTNALTSPLFSNPLPPNTQSICSRAKVKTKNDRKIKHQIIEFDNLFQFLFKQKNYAHSQTHARTHMNMHSHALILTTQKVFESGRMIRKKMGMGESKKHR